MSKKLDGFMEDWKDGAHPNHPGGERSHLCDKCALSHPTVIREIAALKARLVQAAAKLAEAQSEVSSCSRRLGEYAEAVELAEEKQEQAEAKLQEAQREVERLKADLDGTVGFIGFRASSKVWEQRAKQAKSALADARGMAEREHMAWAEQVTEATEAKAALANVKSQLLDTAHDAALTMESWVAATGGLLARETKDREIVDLKARLSQERERGSQLLKTVIDYRRELRVLRREEETRSHPIHEPEHESGLPNERIAGHDPCCAAIRPYDEGDHTMRCNCGASPKSEEVT